MGHARNNGNGDLRSLFERELPHDFQAECALLGSIFYNAKEIIPELRNMVAPADFYPQKHQVIFEHIMGAYEDAGSVDIVLVKHRLEARGLLDSVGGLEYLMDYLVDGVPSGEGWRHYAKIVSNLSRKRAMIEASLQTIKAVYGGVAEPDDIAASSNKRMYELIAKSGSIAQRITHIGDAAMRVWEQACETKETGKSKILKTGFAELDEKLQGIGEGEVWVLAGATSTGKTSLAMNIASNVADSGKTVAIFSLEMTSEALAARKLADMAKVEMKEMRGDRNMMLDKSWDELHNAAMALKEKPIFFVRLPGATIDQIADYCRIIKEQHGLDLVVIDYLQLMNGPGKSTYERVSYNSQNVRNQVALGLGLPVILLSQIARKDENFQGRSKGRTAGRVPKMSDLKESGSIENDADLVMMLYSDDYYRKREQPRGMFQYDNGVQCSVEKNRNGDLCKILLHFDGRWTRFTDWPSGRPVPTWFDGDTGADQVSYREGTEHQAETNLPF